MRIVSQGSGDELTPEQQLLIKDPDAQAMVTKVARRFKRRYGRWAKQEDLLALGQLGLSEAARHFDRNRGTTFAEYAWGRVYGLMMNSVAHELDQWQIARGMFRFLESACDEGDPRRDTEEVQRRALEDFVDMALAAGVVDLVGQATRASAGGEKQAIAQDAIARAVIALDKAVSTLPEIEREILRMHYYKEFDFKEIAPALQLRTAKVRALHRKALRRLGARLRPQGITPEIVREHA